ncbi:hypothetical protein [Mangrovibacter plantisponsor]|uniref:hypothetical protein n=1 Tax=Mangrovibacter plantisponsor TaxID=451513 RepID=UPI000D71896D|nr:hypothetical protein [Mangrovibacter plantisponsor]
MKYIVDCEVKEELLEILKFLKINNVSNNNIFICCPESIYPSEHDSYVGLKYSSVNPRALNKIKQLLILFYAVLRFKPGILFSGYPMLKHRLISLCLFNKVKHYSYLRGLFADSSNFKGYSDKLFLMLRKSKVIKKIGNFQCDKIFTVSEVNKKFLLERDVSEERIFGIPPLWLLDLKSTVRAKNSRVIYFVTQAFASHSCPEAAESQCLFLNELIKEFKSRNLELVIRKHPRDYTSYSIDDNVSIDDRPNYEFLEGIKSQDVLISPFSTLAFEASYLHATVLFYSTPELDALYGNAYKKINAKVFNAPVSVTEFIFSNEYLNKASVCPDMFYSRTDYPPVL